MAKTIAVSNDVYDLLRRAKLPGESFSDVIRRGMKKGVKLSDVWGSGTITHKDWLRARRILHGSEEVTRRKLGSHIR